jgi:lipopolysaccharide export system permease protein
VKITTRYVLREHLGPLVFALSALTSLLLLNYISRRFGDLVGKGLPWRVIGEFFVLSVPFTVAMTLPMAVLVAVLYAFSRLASENEITAFKASGVSMGRLLGPVLWAGLGMAALMVFFNDQVLPRANHRLTVLQGDIARTRPTFALREQVLNEVTPQLVIRASQVFNERSVMRDVTIYDLSQGAPRTVRADSGQLAQQGVDLVMTLYHGDIQQVGENKPGELQRIFFNTQLYRVRDVAKSFAQSQNEGNFKSDREMSICELQAAYLRTRKEHLVAQLEYEQAIADSAKRAPPKELPRKRVFLGLGRLYCEAVRGASSALQVQTAAAMEAPIAQPPATQPPATPATPASQPPTPAPSPSTPPATPPATPPSVPAVPPTDTAALPTPALPTPALPAPDTPSAVVPPAGATGQPITAQPPAPGQPVPDPPSTIPPGVTSGNGVDGMNQSITPNAMVTVARLRLTETATAMNGYDIEIHKKFALAVACIVFVLLGAPVALRFPRGGVGLVIGMSLFVFALYYCFLIAGEELATRGFLPPWLSMWAANVLFGAVGLVLAARMGRESGSARGGGIGEWLSARRHRRASRRRAGAPARAQGTA